MSYPRLYDTCACLELTEIPAEGMCICDVTINELENIKNDRKYAPDKKYKARRFSHLLEDYDDYVDVLFPDAYYHDNDTTIIMTASDFGKILVTNDVLMRLRASRLCDIDVEMMKQEEDNYKGYREMTLQDFSYCDDFGFLLDGEYLIVTADDGSEMFYICNNGKLEVVDNVENFAFYDPLFNKTEPIDRYQVCAFDSLSRNDITLLKGKAGSGKSLLSLAYLFQEYNRDNIDKIVIFANTPATKDSTELGFYPGSRTEKLIDSQIGNMLISHIGGVEGLTRLIADDILMILPMSDIRGIDLSSLRYGVYITEAQNTTVDLMKLCLQRVGDGCKVIIDGDYRAQVDKMSYEGNNNGMHCVSKVFRGNEGYGEVELQTIHRGWIAELADQMSRFA